MASNHRSVCAPAMDADQLPNEKSNAALNRLLVIDCESKRFTVEGPIPASCLDHWYEEMERARLAGRCIFCTPITAADPTEALELFSNLGYDHWPPNTIVATPHKPEQEGSCDKLLPARERNYLGRVLQAKQKSRRHDWLGDVHRMANRWQRVS